MVYYTGKLIEKGIEIMSIGPSAIQTANDDLEKLKNRIIFVSTPSPPLF